MFILLNFSYDHCISDRICSSNHISAFAKARMAVTLIFFIYVRNLKFRMLVTNKFIHLRLLLLIFSFILIVHHLLCHFQRLSEFSSIKTMRKKSIFAKDHRMTTTTPPNRHHQTTTPNHHHHITTITIKTSYNHYLTTTPPYNHHHTTIQPPPHHYTTTTTTPSQAL